MTIERETIVGAAVMLVICLLFWAFLAGAMWIGYLFAGAQLAFILLLLFENCGKWASILFGAPFVAAIAWAVAMAVSGG